MKTRTTSREAIADERRVFRCANQTHWTLASASERMRIHDHRWQDPPGQIREHDYCARACMTTHPLVSEGRPAFCPLGDAAGDDHEWVAVRSEAFRRWDS